MALLSNTYTYIIETLKNWGVKLSPSEREQLEKSPYGIFAQTLAAIVSEYDKARVALQNKITFIQAEMDRLLALRTEVHEHKAAIADSNGTAQKEHHAGAEEIFKPVNEQMDAMQHALQKLFDQLSQLSHKYEQAVQQYRTQTVELQQQHVKTTAAIFERAGIEVTSEAQNEMYQILETGAPTETVHPMVINFQPKMQKMAKEAAQQKQQEWTPNEQAKEDPRWETMEQQAVHHVVHFVNVVMKASANQTIIVRMLETEQEAPNHPIKQMMGEAFSFLIRAHMHQAMFQQVVRQLGQEREGLFSEINQFGKRFNHLETQLKQLQNNSASKAF